MTKSPFVQQPEYVTKNDLNEFADQVQEKLDDLKGELKDCIIESKDKTVKEIKNFVSVFVVDEIKKSETRLSDQLKKVGSDMLTAIRKT